MASGVYTLLSATDPRLQQKEHVFTVPKGASSISMVATNAQAPNVNSNTWQVTPPSMQVGIMNAPVLDFDMILSCFVCQSNGTPAAGTFNNGVAAGTNMQAFCVIGRDIAIACNAPLGCLANSTSIQLNNANVSMLNPIVKDLAHLMDTPNDAAGRCTSWTPPKYFSWNDAHGTTSALGSYADRQGVGDVNPGGYDMTFVGPDGVSLWSKASNQDIPPANWPVDNQGRLIPPDFIGAAQADNTTYNYFYKAGGVVVPFYRGTLLSTGAWSATAVPINGSIPAHNADAYLGNSGVNVPVFLSARIVDVLMCPPFGFNIARSFQTCVLFGVSSMQITMQLTSANVIRLLQGCGLAGAVLVPQTQAVKAITTARVWNTFLTPSTFTELGAQSVMAMPNFTYYPQQSTPSTVNATWVPGMPMQTFDFVFGNITMGAVPDLLCFSFRFLQANQMSDECDACLTLPDGAVVQMNFANLSGLMSGFTSERLASISRKNGVRAGVVQFGGYAGTGYCISGGRRTLVGGAPLLLRPGEDIPLPEGISPGSTGQVQFSFTIRVNVPGSKARPIQCLLTSIASAFFITNQGLSRVVQVGLDVDSVLNAPEGASRFMTSKLVGGGFWGNISAGVKHALSNPMAAAGSAMNAFNAAKSGDLAGAIGHAASAAGLGGGMSGGGLSGGAVKLAGQKRSIAQMLA